MTLYYAVVRLLMSLLCATHCLAVIGCRSDCDPPISCCASCEQAKPRQGACGSCEDSETAAYACPIRSACAIAFFVGEGPARCCDDGCEGTVIHEAKQLCAKGAYIHECAPESGCVQAHRAAALGATYQPWRPVASGTEVPLFAGWGDGAGRFWAVGMYGRVVRTDGGRFADEETPTTETLTDIWGGPDGTLWAVGWNGTIIQRATDGVWSQVPSPTGENLHSIWGQAEDRIWAVGAHGTILHFNGAVWTPETAPENAQRLFDVRGSADAVYVVAHPSIILERQGQGWVAIPLPPEAQITNLWPASDGSLWAAGFGGQTYIRDGGVASWRTVKSITGVPLTALWGDDRGMWAAGARGVILTWRGDTWAPVSYAQDVERIDLQALWGDARELWTAGASGTIYRLAHRTR